MIHTCVLFVYRLLKYCFATPTGIEVQGTRVEGSMLVVRSFLNINLAALRTIVVLRYWAGFFFAQGPAEKALCKLRLEQSLS